MQLQQTLPLSREGRRQDKYIGKSVLPILLCSLSYVVDNSD